MRNEIKMLIANTIIILIILGTITVLGTIVIEAVLNG